MRICYAMLCAMTRFEGFFFYKQKTAYEMRISDWSSDVCSSGLADVVIVGAGHNGMTAAGYLSRAGKRVIVVERSPKVGGMATSGYMIPEAPQHLVTPCAVELLFVRGTGVIEDLELGKHGLRSVDPDPSYVYLHPDGSSIAIFRDPKRTAEDMARLNRNDGRAYLKFLQVLDSTEER